MATEQDGKGPANGAKDATKRKRALSDFPKMTLETGLRVPKALAEANAGQPLPPLDTATALNVSPGSSDFRTILSASLKYGLTTGSYRGERVSLQTLGKQITEPTSPEEVALAIAQAALTPPTFRAIFDYYRGKKLPEKTFFANTVVREFNVPREHAPQCVEIFTANMEYAGLIKHLKTGAWLSAEPVPTGIEPPPADDDDDESGPPDGSAGPDADPLGGTQEEQAPPPIQEPPNEGRRPNAIFIGHGKSRKPLEQLKETLNQLGIPFKVATEEAHGGRPISKKVKDTMEECGAAILIFTADQKFLAEDGSEVWRPSENVVHELGAAGFAYGSRIIVFKEESVQMATNYRDIGYISFEKDRLDAETNDLLKELIAFKIVTVSVA